MITFKIIPNLCVTWVGKNQKIFGFFFLNYYYKNRLETEMGRDGSEQLPVGTCNNAKIFERVE